MSITSMISRKPGPQASVGARTEPPIPYAPRPKPTPPGPHQLGSATLASVQELTNMSAEEIEKLADRVDEAAHETSDGLRAFAHKLRRSGEIANQQLASFVHVASTCAEAANHMQAAIDARNEVQPATETRPETKAAAVAQAEAAIEQALTPKAAADLDAAQAAIGTVMARSGAADDQA